MRSAWDTAHLPAPDRFDYWQHMLTEQLSPTRARSPYAATFNAKVYLVRLHMINLLVTENDLVEVSRTRAMIRRGDQEIYFLTINYRGDQEMVLGRSGALLRPGDMMLMHSSRPIYSNSDPRVRRQRGATFLIEPGLLPGRAHKLDQLLAKPLSRHDSLVSLVGRHLYTLGTGRFRPGEMDQLGAITTSLVALMLARRLDAEHTLPPQTRNEALYARIRQFILTYLGDPGLDADSIAAAHHISTRTLHRLFQANELSVAAWIRGLRLDHCRSDLLNPRLAHRSANSIALKWGFSDAAHFSRIFKARYGLSPAAMRALPPGEPPPDQ